MNTIGSRVKTLREERKMTQQELGDIVGLHGTNVGRIEKNKVFPTSDVLLRLCAFFQVSSDWLLTGDSAFSQISLSADEQRLLDLFRQLPPDARAELLDLAEFKLLRSSPT